MGLSFLAQHRFSRYLVIFLQSLLKCEGRNTNKHVAFALTVSKCSLRSFKRQLNFSASCIDRHTRRTPSPQRLLKEKYLGCKYSSLAVAILMSQLVYIAPEICFSNLFNHIKMWIRFVCCDNVCWVWSSLTVSHIDLFDVHGLTDCMSKQTLCFTFARVDTKSVCKGSSYLFTFLKSPQEI